MTGRELAIKIRTEVRGALADLKAVKQGVVDFNDAVKRNNQKRADLDAVGGQFARIGLAATLAGALVLKTYADFDQAMANVRATGTDAQQNFDALRESALKWGAATKYSATEAAQAQEELLKAGVTAKDILGGGLKGSLDLAAAGNIAVADAAGIAATTMVQFGLAGAQVPHVADVIAAAAGKAMGGVDDLGQALEYVGPVAAQMGISLEETAGAAALLAQNGLLADKAGTGLRAILTSMTSPSQIAAETMQQYGIEVYDAQGHMAGLDNIAGQLHDRLGRLTEAERDAALGRLFGNETVTAARVLYAGGAKEVQKWTKEVNDSGYAAKQAAERQNSLAGDLEKLRGALDTAFIGTGSGQGNALRPLIQTLGDLVDAFNALPQSIQGGLGLLGGTGAIALLAVGGFMKLTTSIAESRVAMDSLRKTSPGVATRLDSMSRMARRAAGGFVALQVAGAVLGESDGPAGINTFSKAILELGTNADHAERRLNNMLSVDAPGFSGLVYKNINGIGDALQQIADGKGVKDVGNTLIGMDSRFAAASKVVGQYDQALASLVASGKLTEAARGFQFMTEQGVKQGLTLRQIKKIFPEYQNALDGMSDSQEEVAEKTSKMAKALGLTDKQLEAQQKAAKELTDQFDSFGKKVDSAKMSVADLRRDFERDARAMARLGENTVKAAARGLDEGVISYLQSKGTDGARLLDKLANGSADAIRKTNKAFRDRTQAVADLQSVLVGLPPNVVTKFSAPGAKDAIQTATKLALQYDLQPATVKTILKALDYSTPQIKAILALMYEADDATAYPTVTVRTGDSLDKLVTLQQYINGMNGKTLKVAVQGSTPGGITLNANGGVWDYYADGGFGRENHVPQIAPAGAWRIWAEPETGGEAYIPFAPSKRDRAIDIWAETGRRLGVNMFAGGGVSGGGSSRGMAGASVTARLVSNRVEVGGDGLARLVDDRVEIYFEEQGRVTRRNGRAGRDS